jgi:hypothetical protein
MCFFIAFVILQHLERTILATLLMVAMSVVHPLSCTRTAGLI